VPHIKIFTTKQWWYHIC